MIFFIMYKSPLSGMLEKKSPGCRRRRVNCSAIENSARVRKIIQNTVSIRKFAEYFFDQGAVYATDVNDLFDSREIVDRRYSGNLGRPAAGHSFIKNLGWLGGCCQILKERFSVHVFKCRLSRLDAVQQVTPRTPAFGLARHD